MFLVARRVIIFALLESARARRGGRGGVATRDAPIERLELCQIQTALSATNLYTTQSMLLDPCDMENRYLSRWRAAGTLFPTTPRVHNHAASSRAENALSSVQLARPLHASAR